MAFSSTFVLINVFTHINNTYLGPNKKYSDKMKQKFLSFFFLFLFSFNREGN